MNALFPPYACRIYPHVFRMTIGLWLLWQPHPTCRPCMRFLSVRPDFCRRLPSDSTSRWTPLPLAICFPSLGRIRDFHPLEHAHAGRTKRNPILRIILKMGFSSYYSTYLFLAAFTASLKSLTGRMVNE